MSRVRPRIRIDSSGHGKTGTTSDGQLCASREARGIRETTKNLAQDAAAPACGRASQPCGQLPVDQPVGDRRKQTYFRVPLRPLRGANAAAGAKPEARVRPAAWRRTAEPEPAAPCCMAPEPNLKSGPDSPITNQSAAPLSVGHCQCCGFPPGGCCVRFPPGGCCVRARCRLDKSCW